MLACAIVQWFSVFFSSRRRHTRCSRDWSSDVCSSDLTNLLLRQYFPRGTDLSAISQEQLDQVELLLNHRPRKILGFQTPASKLQASVASTKIGRASCRERV